MGSSLDDLLKAEFKEAFDEFDKVSLGETSTSPHCTSVQCSVRIKDWIY